MDNFKNNKIIKRIISLMLCIALLITSVQVSNLINKDISGLDETQTDKKITSFIHSNIVIDADDLSAALYKLPYTIAVSMSDGTTEVISISEWKKYSDEGEINSVHRYYYEMVLDTNYELIPALKTPLAEINISQNKTSVQSLDDRLIVDDGVYEIKGTKEIPVCEHCYRVLSEQGLCPECNKKTSSCTCEDIDIDLNNENSIHAWMKNNTPNFEFTSKKDTLGREILDYDDEWWDNLKSNQRILAETIYKHVVYNPDRPDLLCGYLSYCTIPELITFINNNRCNFDFSEHFKEHNSVIQYLTLEQLLQIEQIDPDLQFNDLEHMINYMNDHKSASDEQIRNVKAHIKLIDDDVFDVLKEVANTVISKSILTSSINKKYKTSILSNPSNYSLTLTASSATACTTEYDSETKSATAVDGYYTVGGKTAACGTHKSTSPDGSLFNYAGDSGGDSIIGGIILYMASISPTENKREYCMAQRAIWYHLGQLASRSYEGHSCATTSNSCGVNGCTSHEWECSIAGDAQSGMALAHVLINGGPIPAGYAGEGEFNIISTKYYIWQKDGGYQEMLTADNPPPERIPPEVFEAKNEYRSRLIVKHNLTGTIDDNGVGVMGKWTPKSGLTYKYNDNTNWTTSGGDGATYCGTNCESIVDKTSGYGDPETITKKEQKALTDTSAWSSLGGSNKHWNFTTSDNRVEDRLDEAENKLYEGYITRTYTWKTYSDYYCGSGTHTIDKPNVNNYKLTLHYQGGYYDGNTDDFDTVSSMSNTCNYSNVGTFDDTLGNDNVSTEKTNVKFKTMAITGSYKLNSFTTSRSPHPAAGTLAKDGETWKFTHKTNSDGVQSVVEFKYKNYYIVTLPTPKRVGYNFLGWYTAATGGTKVEPKTITANGTTFDNAYVLKKNTTLYAHWELITKDETFEIKWLDNYNNYTTRPDAVYVELWRYTTDTDAENCEGYITEELNKGTKDWITRFSNETGLSNKGAPFYTGGTKTSTIFDPNKYLTYTNDDSNTENEYNNIFHYSDYANRIERDVIKVQLEGLDKDENGNLIGDNNNPASSNTWQFTLKNLQKFDTQCEDWHEYKYVIKEVICESLDETTYYYTSPDDANNDYTKPMSNYYNIKNNNNSLSGANKFSDYEALDIKTKFSNVVVNRIGNSVKGVNPWKSVVVKIQYNDASDKYHFRPYSLKVQLYQNLANYKNTSSENYLDKSGVRILYRTENAQMNKAYAYSSTVTDKRVGISTSNSNWFYVRFEDLPTVEDSTGIKIAYDAVLTYGQSRYRYTIDDTDEYNNLGQSIKNYGSNHYYSIKHQTSIQSIIDLDYTYMRKDNQFVAILPITKDKYITSAGKWLSQMTTINKSEVQSKKTAGWYFEPDNRNDIFQAANSINSGLLLKNDYDDNTYIIDTVGQKIKYRDGNLGYASAFSSEYKSMAYNLRYYYITESNEMTSVSNYAKRPISVPDNKKIEYLFFTETLRWTFNVDLNKSPLTPLPGEFTGSNSSDDRTGNYTGTADDDYSHTNNKLIISSIVKNQNGSIISAEDEAYKKLQIDQSHEGFLITLKQIKKTWTGNADTTSEYYTNDAYSNNGYTSYSYKNDKLSEEFQPQSEIPSPGSAAYEAGATYSKVGNEYNIYVPANGSTTLEYLPDGKYEVTCHYDIDFSNFTFETTAGKTASITKESNEKYYLTFSSATPQDNQDITHSATIDYWRGYVDDMNNFSWARPLRDNNFGLVSGEPSNKDDKTLFPFGNNDKKNTITYGRIFIRNNPYSYSAFETGNGTTMNVTKCPIHNTQLVNGKCNEIGCIFTEYEYISNGTTILDEKLPYNVYSQRQGSEKTYTK